MRRIRAAIFAALAVASLTSLAGQPTTKPTTRPASKGTFAFVDDFHIYHYLQLAEDFQKLDPAKRAERLREMADDAERASQVFPLCRMLFEAKTDKKFRRPMIGGPSLIGGRDAVWPLEPITMVDHVPILIVRGYNLAGFPEPPQRYVDYCLKECHWSETKYAVIGTAKLKAIVESFIAAHPELLNEWWDDPNFIRRQAE